MRSDEAAIQEILNRMEAAWNVYDSAALAALFAEDAVFIQIFGGQLDGRAAIQGSHQSIFDTIYKGSRARFTLRGIRFVRPDVAVVLTGAHLDLQEGGPVREVDARPTMVVAKQDGRWEIVAFQNTRVSPIPAAAEVAARLAT